MKHNFTFEQLKKLCIASVLMIGTLVSGQNNGPALEMAAGSGNPTGNGPVLTSTIFFQNNTDNTTTGTTFTPYAPTLTATYTVSNSRYTTTVNNSTTNIGHNGAAAPIFDLMNSQGSPSNTDFTSAGASATTGIVGANNRAVRMFVMTYPLLVATRPTNGTYPMADLTITFSRPVNNPVIHLGAIGGTTAAGLGFAGRFDLSASTPSGVTLTRLSGNNATGFQTSATSIFNGAATFTATGANSGSGSVRVNGTGITSLTFVISIKGDGAVAATTAWAANNTDTTTGEAITVGFSTLENDIELTKTMGNTTAAAGSTTNFVITARNNGPSNNANINISDVLPSGYSYNGTPITSTGTYSTGTGVWNIPLLDNGASATLNIPVNVLATGNYVNTATVTSATVADSNTGNNRATAARIPDSDNDGVFDNVDLDDDNDGIPDTLEETCLKTSQIVNGNFSSTNTSWATGFYATPNTTGPITFNTTLGTLDIFADNAGSLYSGNIILANTAPVAIREGVLYNFSSTLNIIGGTTNTNFSWVLIDSSNNIVQTLQTYKTLASGIGNVTITATATAYPVSFFATGTGNYRLALTWITNSAASGNAQDVRIDDVTLLTPCNSDADGIPNYLDLDSDNDGCFDAIEGDENVLPSQLNANGSINITTTGGIGSTAGTNNGIPNLVNSGGLADVGGDVGQGIGDSQSSTANTQCIDTDGDGIPDNIDLDDDNDGILDTVEDACAFEGTAVYINTFTTGARTSDPNVLNHTYAATGTIADGSYSVTTSADAVNAYSQTDATGNLDAGNPVITAGSTTGRYLMINMGANLGNQVIYRVSNMPVTAGTRYRFRIDMAGLSVGAVAVPNLQLSLKDAGGTLLASANSGAIGMANDDVWRRLPLEFVASTTGNVTLEIVNLQPNTSGNDLGIDNIILAPYFICDTDGDGIPNSRDLDSDGDGCSDVIEGGANFQTGASYIVGNRLNTTVNTSGVPAVPTATPAITGYSQATGQTIGQSQDWTKNDCLDTDGDGIPNWQDLDDDNDGILDTVEDACETEGTPVYINTFGTGGRIADSNVQNHTFVATGSIGDGFYSVTTSAATVDTFSQTDLTGNLDAGNPVITAGSTTGRYLMINIDSPGTMNRPIYKVDNLPTTVGRRYRFRVDMAGLSNGAVPIFVLTLKDTSGNVLATSNSTNIGVANDDVWRRLTLNFVATTSTVVLEIVNLQSNGGGNDVGIDNIILTPITICDTDGDGIPNSQDLDSDGDGCADAIEGGANITNSQLVTAGGTATGGGTSVNQNLCATGACVNTSGVPQFVTLPTGYSNSTGQAIGQSQDASKNDCIDSDGDLIPDWQDLDDDNDGILDTVECGFVCGDPFVNGGFEFPVISGVSNAFYDQSTSGLGWQTTATDGLIEVWRSGFNSVPSAEGSQFAELNATQASTLYQTFCVNSAGGTINWSIKHRGRDGVDVAAVKFGTTLATAQSSTAVQTMTDGNTAWGTYSGTYTIPPGNTSFVVAFQAISTSTGNNASGNFIDDVQITLNQPCLDTDGDGIPNSLDLDSDNDGCPDAIEGGANFTTSNLVTATGTISTQTPNQNLGNTVGNTTTTMGVPTIAGTGQSIGQSQDGSKNDCVDSDADGIPDWQDLDDDNDGIPDTAECSLNFASYAVNNFSTPVPAIVGSTSDNTKFLQLRPSDFGLLTAGATNQNASRDYSSFFGLPTGSIIVTLENAHVHPNATANPASNVFYVSARNGVGSTRVRVSGTVGSYVAIEHGQEYYGAHERGIQFLDGAHLTSTNISDIGSRTTGGNWQVGSTGNYYFVRHTTAATENAVFAYGVINPEINPKLIGVSTNNTVLTEYSTYFIRIFPECDTDKDGIPNRLDLDSDNDGCFDALEGDENVDLAQLNANGSINTTTTGGLGNVSTNVGVPNLVNSGGAADIGGDVGQGAGDSQDALTRSCFCYKKPILDAGSNVPVQHGITALSRANSGAANWPVVRQSAWTVLEANTKGFVVNRVAFEDADNNASTPTTPVGIAPANYLEGMMVYDTVANCLKIYNGSFWNCYSTQACPPDITN